MTELSGFEGAVTRINKIAEVRRVMIRPSTVLIILPEPREWSFKFEEEGYHRTSRIVWPPSHRSIDI